MSFGTKIDSPVWGQEPGSRHSWETCWRVLTVITNVHGTQTYLQISSYATIECKCQETKPPESPVDWDNVYVPGAPGTGSNQWQYKGVYVDAVDYCVPNIPIMCKTPNPRIYQAGTHKPKRSNDKAINGTTISSYHDAALAKSRSNIICIHKRDRTGLV
jgi:hypothetical protein